MCTKSIKFSKKLLCHDKEFYHEQCRNEQCQQRNILGFSKEDLKEGIGNHCKSDTVSDRSRNRHCYQHDEYRHNLVHIVHVDFLQSLKHYDADINKCG